MSEQEFNMDELAESIEDIVERAVQEAAGDAFNDLEEAIRETTEDVLGELLEEKVHSAVYEAAQDVLPEIFASCLADYDFMLKDGTIVKPRQRMKVLSPDKSKLLICYGGLRVDGKSLIIQTRVSSWEWIADYPDREAAVAALKLVHEAMKAGETLLELP